MAGRRSAMMGCAEPSPPRRACALPGRRRGGRPAEPRGRGVPRSRRRGNRAGRRGSRRLAPRGGDQGGVTEEGMVLRGVGWRWGDRPAAPRILRIPPVLPGNFTPRVGRGAHPETRRPRGGNSPRGKSWADFKWVFLSSESWELA